MVHAVSEVFFLGWIVDQDQDRKVLLVQGEEEHLNVLRHGWTRRVLHPPPGYSIKCIGNATRRAASYELIGLGRHSNKGCCSSSSSSSSSTTTTTEK
ncbi:hypothetical protein CRUP_034658 [Coryphaenoides rupestris]|nr:hypothetical protein CRUP_034658 [Coryphaenoides rupestris]